MTVWFSVKVIYETLLKISIGAKTVDLKWPWKVKGQNAPYQKILFITNSNLPDIPWLQASLEVKDVQPRERCVSSLAIPAFTASVASTLSFQVIDVLGHTSSDNSYFQFYLTSYFRLAAKLFDSAEFIAVSTLTLTIFLCWRLWSLSLRDRLSLKPNTSSQTCHLFLILTWVGSMRRMFPQNLEPPPWRIRPLKSCGVITKVLSILLQERFLEDVCVPRNHGYPRLLLLLLISAGKLSEGEM